MVILASPPLLSLVFLPFFISLPPPSSLSLCLILPWSLCSHSFPLSLPLSLSPLFSPTSFLSSNVSFPFPLPSPCSFSLFSPPFSSFSCPHPIALSLPFSLSGYRGPLRVGWNSLFYLLNMHSGMELFHLCLCDGLDI